MLLPSLTLELITKLVQGFINPRTYKLNSALLEFSTTPRVKAIIPVSLYGHCTEYDTIKAIAAKHCILVIKDAAESFGATYHVRKSCNLTNIACTSFFPSKQLCAYGDGGAIFDNEPELAKVMRQIASHVEDRCYYYTRVGINSHSDTLKSAILLPKLAIFDQETVFRQKAATHYTNLFSYAIARESRQSISSQIIPPTIAPYNTSAWAQYTIRVSNRETIQERLKHASIQTTLHFPIMLYKQPAVAYGTAHIPNGDTAAQHVLGIPIQPSAEEADQMRVIAALAKALA